MASPAQIAANFANAQHSTGPKTDAGKKTSSRNALTHGLYSCLIVIKGESQEEYEAFRAEAFVDLAPATLIEATFVDDLAATLWRLRRIQRLEDKAFNIDDLDLPRIQILSTMSSRLRRDAAAALRSLHQIQHQRQAREKEQLAAAISIRKADLAANRSTDLQQFGFDLSIAFVDQKISLQNAIRGGSAPLTTVASPHAA